LQQMGDGVEEGVHHILLSLTYEKNCCF
jgi:hypothetical protein